MKLPRRRSSRPRGRARLALAGDFPAADRDVTEAVRAIPPAPWHGTTIPLAALRGEPHYPRSDLRPPPPPHPAPVTDPPRTHSAAGRGWTMTVNTGGPGVPMDTRLRRARGFLDLKVAYLKARGMGYRIDDAEQVLQRGEELPAGSVMADTHAEAVTHLLGNRSEWTPAGGWDHGWAEGLHWYDPEVREPWWDQPASGGTA